MVVVEQKYPYCREVVLIFSFKEMQSRFDETATEAVGMDANLCINSHFLLSSNL